VRAVGISDVHRRRRRRRDHHQFTLGWKTQGSDAAFFYAKDNGYFKDEGLNVVIDQGEARAHGDAYHVGGYDAGFGDVNAIIQNASTGRRSALSWSNMMWTSRRFAIVAKNGSGINSIKDSRAIPGRRAGHADDAGLLPCCAEEQARGRQDQGLNWRRTCRKPMRSRAISTLPWCHTPATHLVLNRQDPTRYKWFLVRRYGMDLFQRVMVSRKLLTQIPRLGRLVRGHHKGLLAVAKDRTPAEGGLNYDNLINVRGREGAACNIPSTN